MATAYRIAKAKFSRSAQEMLSGQGGLAAGARWHTRGRRMIYTAGSLSLATLEIAVHLQGTYVINAYRALRLTIPDDIIFQPEEKSLPTGWQDRGPPLPAVQQFGDQWYDSHSSCVMQVPSAVVPSEYNYLINPEHEDFGRIEYADPEDYPFDPRIKK